VANLDLDHNNKPRNQTLHPPRAPNTVIILPPILAELFIKRQEGQSPSEIFTTVIQFLAMEDEKDAIGTFVMEEDPKENNSDEENETSAH